MASGVSYFRMLVYHRFIFNKEINKMSQLALERIEMMRVKAGPYQVAHQTFENVRCCWKRSRLIHKRFRVNETTML